MKFQFQLNNDLINFFKYFKIRLLAARAGHAFLAITRRRLDVYIRFRSNTHTHISIRGWWRGWWWDHWLMTSLECMAHSPPANWTQHNTHAAPDPPLLWSSIFGLFMVFLINIWIFSSSSTIPLKRSLTGPKMEALTADRSSQFAAKRLHRSTCVENQSCRTFKELSIGIRWVNIWRGMT